MDLVTLEQAKTHLRVDGTESDVEISELIFRASSIIMDYLKKPVPLLWNSPDDPVLPGTGVPGLVQAATLLVIASLFANRGDKADGSKEVDPITVGVESLLRRQRDPALQ